ncbi:hypothetical protein MVEN_01641600 [Mycena venus]|uniref:Uncharacterized protein n=1 Tax=Mycena venus TaxID=2733690 RepID=A0A8H6XN51_9AGAR|nr:hypothetical protein MVEN_01641600 [Mycena venus]
MSFSEYATPVATLKYSPQYFASLTFACAEELDYPTIATSSIIERWCFSNDIPTTAAGTVIQPGEHFPRFQDLHPIVREMEKAFADGARSVSLVLNVGGQRYDVQFHFLKIHLFVAINNNYPAVLGARNVFRHTISNNLLLSTALDNFGDFLLWKLACLLRETWLEEDVVNALLELATLSSIITCVHHEALVEDWLIPCLIAPAGMEELNVVDDGPVGFNDFNLHRPTINHPIHSFWENVKKEPPVELPAPPKPSLSQRVPPLPKLAGVSVEPAIIILDSDSEEGSDDESVIDLTCSSPVIKQETTIDLAHTSPSPLLLAGMIVLQDPNEDADDIVVISDLCPICSASSTQPQKPKLEPLSDISNSQQPPLQIIGDINIGKTYNSFEEGQADICALEMRRGHIWRIAQTKKVNDVPKRITLRCNHYYRYPQPSAHHQPLQS